MQRKILYSPGYGSGWSSSNFGEVAKYMLTYQPIIDFIEGGNSFKREESCTLKEEKLHPLLQQLIKECKEKFNADYVCVFGAYDLRVCTVNGRVRIKQRDGSESVEEEGPYNNWM